MVRLLLIICLILPLNIAASPHNILLLGDSLSDAYNIDIEASWVTLLQQRLKEQQLRFQPVNASISGATTSNVLINLDSELAKVNPAIVILEIGGNDGLRGLDLTQTQANLEAIITKAKKYADKILFLEMLLPPNYGPVYTDKFKAMYSELSTKYNLTLVPFILEEIALQPELMQADGIHPTAAAQELILEQVWEYLYPMLAK